MIFLLIFRKNNPGKLPFLAISRGLLKMFYRNRNITVPNGPSVHGALGTDEQFADAAAQGTPFGRVGVALETVKQLEAQMLMRHYKGFLE